VVVITETDGMDESGGTSREADKITQIEGRTRAFGDRARIYMECTVSTETGRTWQEYNGGTASAIAIRCPHCARTSPPSANTWSGGRVPRTCWRRAIRPASRARVRRDVDRGRAEGRERRLRLIHKGQT
jgi:phage terminase large subunit GpA-like protein